MRRLRRVWLFLRAEIYTYASAEFFQLCCWASCVNTHLSDCLAICQNISTPITSRTLFKFLFLTVSLKNQLWKMHRLPQCFRCGQFGHVQLSCPNPANPEARLLCNQLSRAQRTADQHREYLDRYNLRREASQQYKVSNNLVLWVMVNYFNCKILQNFNFWIFYFRGLWLHFSPWSTGKWILFWKSKTGWRTFVLMILGKLWSQPFKFEP